MSACARCGLEACPDGDDKLDSLPYDGLAASLGCRERELANLRSLLRSVTGKLEEANEILDGGDRFAMEKAAALIDSVLEALS